MKGGKGTVCLSNFVFGFLGVGVADKKIVHDEGEGSGVGVVAEEHGGGSVGEPVLGEKSDKTKLG